MDCGGEKRSELVVVRWLVRGGAPFVEFSLTSDVLRAVFLLLKVFPNDAEETKTRWTLLSQRDGDVNTSGSFAEARKILEGFPTSRWGWNGRRWRDIGRYAREITGGCWYRADDLFGV